MNQVFYIFKSPRKKDRIKKGCNNSMVMYLYYMNAIMKFHFWGKFSSKIIVCSENRDQLERLKKEIDFQATDDRHDACGRIHKAEGWSEISQVEKNEKPMFLFQAWFGKNDSDIAVEKIKKIKGGEKIDSMATSIDHGPLCTLEF